MGPPGRRQRARVIGLKIAWCQTCPVPPWPPPPRLSHKRRAWPSLPWETPRLSVPRIGRGAARSMQGHVAAVAEDSTEGDSEDGSVARAAFLHPPPRGPGSTSVLGGPRPLARPPLSSSVPARTPSTTCPSRSLIFCCHPLFLFHRGRAAEGQERGLGAWSACDRPGLPPARGAGSVPGCGRSLCRGAVVRSDASRSGAEAGRTWARRTSVQGP